MSYESESFVEHHKTRIPILDSLVGLGWSRRQIIAPSPDSDDREWHVPRNPSEAEKRERGRHFDGFPVDIALFDSIEGRGMYDHITAIIECKAPDKPKAVAQLKTYLGLEPHARMGVWTNGTEVVRVYKLASPGGYKVEENASLPKPTENFILSGASPLTYEDMRIPSEAELRKVFEELLDSIVSRDGSSTRREDQLDQLCNMLLVKLDSDHEGAWEPKEAVDFQLSDEPLRTAERINAAFAAYRVEHPTLFSTHEGSAVAFDNETIQEVVLKLQGLNIGSMAPAALSLAFQIFRDASLKLGEGQYYTPTRVIEAGTELLGITHKDMVIDPACGTGGFLSSALMRITAAGLGDKATTQWAHYKLFGVDRDKTNIKLTRALMVGVGDGSTNAHQGDSLRSSKWTGDAAGLASVLGEGRYTVVVTNPPFGKNLVISAADAMESQLTICKHTPGGLPSETYADTTELGIAFVERAWRILQNGGRLGIVLPETYFFSKTYRWFREWLDGRFLLRGVLNVPMEAFQGFCRAKTNFYVFEKIGQGPRASRPKWFKDGSVWVSWAPTIGLNKDGADLYVVDSEGKRTDEINDLAGRDVRALLEGSCTDTAAFVPYEPPKTSYIGVPRFYSASSGPGIEEKVASRLPGFRTVSLGELIDAGILSACGGHGSPSADIRNGDIPYIKVSDLRAGRVNPNPSNLVSRAVAERFWKGRDSGVRAWQIVTPARASKNIGEPCMVMPGQENMLLTKEVLRLEVAEDAPIDPFFLFWALSLKEVREQWSNVVFMQTNREDLGDRYTLVRIPYTENKELAESVSSGHRAYFTELDRLLQSYRSLPTEL